MTDPSATVRSYLGDAVYVRQTPHGALVLTTENGITVTNTVVLEPEVLAALLDWLNSHRRQQR